MPWNLKLKLAYFLRGLNGVYKHPLRRPYSLAHLVSTMALQLSRVEGDWAGYLRPSRLTTTKNITMAVEECVSRLDQETYARALNGLMAHRYRFLFEVVVCGTKKLSQ